MRPAGAAVVLVVASGCGSGQLGEENALALGVATSFRSAAESLSDLASTVDLEVSVSASPTPTLAAQVRDGAGLDVVVLADEDIARELSDSGLLDPMRLEMTTEVVLAVPRGNPAGVVGLADLARPELNVGLCDPTVPCGSYAGRWLADRPTSVDTYEPSSASLVGRLVSGDLDVGVTYHSETISSGGAIEEVALPDDPGPTATLVVASVASSSKGDALDRFADLLADRPARAIIEAAGYRLDG